MQFSKKETAFMKKLDDTVIELNKCGDEHCPNTITAKEMEEQGIEFGRKVMQKCRSKSMPKNEQERIIRAMKYDACFKKFRNGSSYYKKQTQRNKCVDKKCGIYQNKIQKMLDSKKKNKTKKSIK
jgi:hypothetical protein